MQVGTETNALTTTDMPDTSSWRISIPEFLVDKPYVSSTGHLFYTNMLVRIKVEREYYMWMCVSRPENTLPRLPRQSACAAILWYVAML